MTTSKIEQGKSFLAKVEADLGYAIDANLVDLFMDNADTLGFSDDECLSVANVIRAERGLPLIAKWW